MYTSDFSNRKLGHDMSIGVYLMKKLGLFMDCKTKEVEREEIRNCMASSCNKVTKSTCILYIRVNMHYK